MTEMDLRAVNHVQFLDAKRYWAAASTAKLIIFVLGLWGVLSVTPIEYLPQIVLVITIISELLQMRSDGLKSRAESLLRKLDICRSFGHDISEADKRDIIVTIPHRIRKRFVDKAASDTYFASTSTPGPRRAVENLHESAWYNGRQAARMAGIYTAMISVLLILSITSLIFAMRQVDEAMQQERVIKIVTAWLMLIVSLNMLKSAWSYFKMSQRCARTEEATLRLIQSQVSEADALRQWHEYQVARSACPLIPQWLWKMMERSLNDAWAAARVKTSTGAG